MKTRVLHLLRGLSALERVVLDLMKVEGSFPGAEVKMGNSDLGRGGRPSRRCPSRSSRKIYRKIVCSSFLKKIVASAWTIRVSASFLTHSLLVSVSLLFFFFPYSFCTHFGFLEATSYDSVLILPASRRLVYHIHL